MTKPTPAVSTAGAAGTDRPLVVGIGGSAGAVTALQQFFDAVPEEPGLAFVVIMHLAPEKKSELAEILDTRTSLPVTQVTKPIPIEENHVYVVAPGQTLLFEGRSLVPSELENTDERRFPIDRFFRSLAGAPVEPIGVVLSGAGTDGSVGLRLIKEAGGVIAAQDPSEAEHASMPRSAIESSRVDLVLPVAELARRLSDQPQVFAQLELPEDPEGTREEEALDEIVDDIFAEVRTRTGHDFSNYKRSTMLRRIQRRLQVHQISSFSDYLSFVKEQPSEATALLKDCLISVTSFFRDPEAFATLGDEVIPEILSDKEPGQQVRAWAVGCATGEEAYSLAMLLLEQAESRNVVPEQIQVFATDLDEEGLATARKGRYPEAIAADVPDRYLDRFFHTDGTEFIVRPEVRERILFTTHDLLTDPPFSNLDLISCRNLLIYLQRELQETVFELFSYALREEGYLFLGSSESADLAENYFQVDNKSHRLYRRRQGTNVVPELPSGPLAPRIPEEVQTQLLDPTDAHPNSSFDGGFGGNGTEDSPVSAASEAVLHRHLLEAYAPPSAVVNEDYRFLHLSPDVGRFLHHPGGTPNDNLVEMVRPELKIKLRSALREAFAEDKAIQTEKTGVKFDGETRPVRLIVRPARQPTKGQELALVLFEEPEEEEEEEEEPSEQQFPEGDRAAAERVAHLEAELQQTKEELRTTIADHQASKQEMQAANEELRSMNEEYRSTAEELETSKEELQSVNEELKSVNRELEDKVLELKEANADLESLMAATDIGTLFLDRELRIQRFTPRIEELFSIRPADEGRPVGHLTHQLDYDELVQDARRVIRENGVVEQEVESEEGEWFLVRHHPHRSAEDDVDGAVVTFVDITRRKEAEQKLRSSNESLKRRTQQVQRLTDALTTAEEDERKRLSEVLHDSLQQTLFAAQMKIDTLQAQSDLTEKQQSFAEKAAELIRTGMQTTRTLSKELNPPVGDQPLVDSFEWLARQMRDSYGIVVAVETEGAAPARDERLSKNLQSLLFRLVKELLFNVVKHAEVDDALVRLGEDENGVRVVVEDEGEGFDVAILEEETDEVHGLRSVRDRIEMIGGRFDIEAAPGKGTRVTLVVPRQTDGLEPL